jgi:DNA-binding GntR family transcriptional regulator
VLQANMAFHKVINVAGDNPEAERIVHRGWDLVHALRLQYGFGESRDSARAATIANQHCQSTRDDLLAQMV